MPYPIRTISKMGLLESLGSITGAAPRRETEHRLLEHLGIDVAR